MSEFKIALIPEDQAKKTGIKHYSENGMVDICDTRNKELFEWMRTYNFKEQL